MEFSNKTISVKELQKILSNIHMSTLIIYLSHCRFAKYKSTPFSGAKARYYLNNDFLDLLYTLLLNRRRYEAAENLQNHFKDVKCLDWGDFICKSLSLDAEFKMYKDIHRMAILQAKLITYYRTVQESGITIPFFMLESPEKRAEREVQELFDKDKETFNALYEQAWAQYAECLP